MVQGLHWSPKLGYSKPFKPRKYTMELLAAFGDLGPSQGKPSQTNREPRVWIAELLAWSLWQSFGPISCLLYLGVTPVDGLSVWQS